MESTLATRAGTTGNSTVSSELGCSFQATFKRLVVNPGEHGGQELIATLFVIVPNNIVDELRCLVGQPVMLRVQSRQLPLPLDTGKSSVADGHVPFVATGPTMPLTGR